MSHHLSMDNELPPNLPVFEAPPRTERKIVAVKNENRISRPNLVPDDILHDEFLNELIENSLPRNYNFEVHKTIWKIKQTNSKRVLLQFPEGLIRFGPILVDIINGYFRVCNQDDVNIITMGDLTYGACCIDDYLASSLECDLVVHYAHSCLVPINKLNASVKFLYIFLDIKFDLEHIIDCINHNFDPGHDRIALASTIQFVASVHEVARSLRQSGYTIELPQSRPLSAGEILGCTAPKLDKETNTILFICDGRFHLEALMIANPDIKAFRYDPYSRKLTRESYAFDQMLKIRGSAVERAYKVMEDGGTFGFILGTLGRQGSESVFDRLSEKLKYTNCKSLKIMMPEVLPNFVNTFDTVDVWVQVACPRLSIDWGSFYNRPLLNPYEFIQSLRKYLNITGLPSDIGPRNYPMDFYAKNSSCDHTPNHACSNNPSCECSTLNHG